MFPAIQLNVQIYITYFIAGTVFLLLLVMDQIQQHTLDWSLLIHQVRALSLYWCFNSEI